MFKKILASATVVAMMTGMFGTTAFATELQEWNTNGGQSEVEGEGYVVEPTLSVELPGDLAFGINPLELDADGDPETTGDDGQIVSVDYQILNYSDVAVIVTAATKVEAGEDVELATNPTMDANTKELPAVEGKKAIWLVQQLPTADATIAEDGTVTLGVTALAKGSADIDAVGYELSAADTTVLYMLDKYDATTDKLVAGNVGGFRFTGAVDPNAAFVEGDVKVVTLFTLNAITETQKGGYEADATFKNVVTEK